MTELDTGLPEHPLGEVVPKEPDQPVVDPNASLWHEIAPELGDSHATLSSEEQVRYLLKKHKKQPPVQPAIVDAPLAVPTAQVPAEAPYAQEIPDLDMAGLKSTLTEALGDEAAAKISKYFEDQNRHVTGSMRLVSGALEEQNGQFSKFEGQLRTVTLPGQLTSSVGVGGSTAEDVIQATKLISDGITTDPAMAMRLAASFRNEALASARGPNPSPEALAASALSQAATRPGVPMGSIPTNAQGIAELLREPD